MDLSYFKTPDVTPMLVKLYDKHKHYLKADNEKPAARNELTTTVSELLQMNLSPREGELVADVLISLLRQAELDLRQAMAERLAIFSDIPVRIILELAHDEIAVASPVLRKSEVLGDLDLIYIIKSKTPEYWQEIAKRKNLSNVVMETLVKTKDLKTAINITDNAEIILSRNTLEILVNLTTSYEALGVPLLRRQELTSDLALELYKVAGAALKSVMTHKFPAFESILADTAQDLHIDVIEELDDNSLIPSPRLISYAKDLQEKNLLSDTLLMKVLKKGEKKKFIALLTQFSGLSVDNILRGLSQPHGQLLAVICKAHNIMKSDFVSMYLLTNIFRNHHKTVDTKSLEKAIEYFDRIDQKTAEDLLLSAKAQRH